MIDDDVDLAFEAVRALVEAGEYLDRIPGVSGVVTEGDGPYESDAAGRPIRVYQRGTPEHIAARDAGRVEPLPRLTPATAEAVLECETVLGHRLPPLLRRCYLELGNGGFGPGYGLLGLRDGHAPYCETAIDLYRQQRRGWPEAWQSMAGRLLPVCDWRAGVVSLVDCCHPAAAMWAIDPGSAAAPWTIDPDSAPQETAAPSLLPQHLGFAEWLWRWTVLDFHTFTQSDCHSG